jgi:predicted transcriptional regulator of viral defense system
MGPQDRTAEVVIGQIASTQHGVVTRAQLLAAGVSSDEIRWRLREGALLRVHRGVYRVGHKAPSIEARYMAAVLACGPGAALSHRSAADLQGLRQCNRRAIEVAAPRDITHVNGIPCTQSHAHSST